MSSTFNEIINSIRRVTGDINSDSYRVSTKDLSYFLQDAVDEVQADINFGYELTLTDTSFSWNQTLYATPFVLFKLKSLILVLESTFHDGLWYAGNINVGDIKIDLTPILKLRMENLKRLREDYEKLLYSVKMNTGTGYEIDTFVTGLIRNVSSNDYLCWEPAQ